MGKLWHILISSGLDTVLVHFLAHLHEATKARVRISQQGEVTGEIKIQRGVRHGCVLAPLLFILHVNDLHPALLDATQDVPVIRSNPLPALL